MTNAIRQLPELKSLDRSRDLIRIPPETDVPVTPRVLRLLETEPFRRLAHISQLGLVSQVYPGATHTRLEHSLGVYRLSLFYLKSLSEDPLFLSKVDGDHAKLFIVAALMHDIGHWPFCHPIEDMRLDGIPRHEAMARRLLLETEIADRLREDWEIDPQWVADLIAPQQKGPPSILSSMLSGPIDIDKLDYLDRDSLHAGVPYGRNFDRQRLIHSLCVGPTGNELAVSDKGRTAAEMMVFARYVMFSEVYWHHAVRSATAMLQRSVFALSDRPEVITSWRDMEERSMVSSFLNVSKSTSSESIVQGLFGPSRKLYKRLAQYNCNRHPELHAALARRPYAQLVTIAERLAGRLSSHFGREILPHEVIVDAPPVKLEVQFQVYVKQRGGEFLSMGEVSPVVKALATQQFDDVVKRVHIFVPMHVKRIVGEESIEPLLWQVIEDLGS